MVLGKGFGCWNTMPTSRRSATGSMPFENTETPSSRMSPAWRVCGISSFNRFTERKKVRSEEHTSELQSRLHLVCRLLLEKKKKHSTTLRLRGLTRGLH